MTILPREDQPALAPLNANTPFISSQNMRAAATSAPRAGADPNLINQDGIGDAGLSLTTRDFVPGHEKELSPPPATDPVVSTESAPPPPDNQRPPEPDAVVKTADPLAPAPADPVVKMRERPPETLTLTQGADSPPRPKTPPVPPRDPAVSNPARSQAGRNPLTSSVKTKSTGGMAVRGDENSVDARDTPEGRFIATMHERIGLLWNSRLATVHSLAGTGVVEVEFDIDVNGRIANVRLVDPGKANPILEDVCLTSVIKAKLPPLPASLKRELDDPLSGGRLHRKVGFYRIPRS